MRDAIERAAANNALRQQRIDEVKQSFGSRPTAGSVLFNILSMPEQGRIDAEARRLQPLIQEENRRQRSQMAQDIEAATGQRLNPDSFDLPTMQTLYQKTFENKLTPRTSDIPSDVRSFEYYKKLSPEDRVLYERQKRTDPYASKGLTLTPEGNVVPTQGFAEGVANTEYLKQKRGEEGKIAGGVLPDKIQMKQDELIDEITIGRSISTEMGAFINKIDTGELDLNVVANASNALKNNLSLSTEQSRALSDFDSFIEKLRNDTLRLNKGVQTEGDAQRAMNEVIKSKNDPKLVRQRLEVLQRVNEKGARLKELRLQLLREENRKPELDIGAFTETAAQSAYATKPVENVPTGQSILTPDLTKLSNEELLRMLNE